MAMAIRVFYALTTDETPKYSLPELRDDVVAAILACPAIRENLSGSFGQAKRIITSAECQHPGIRCDVL